MKDRKWWSSVPAWWRAPPPEPPPMPPPAPPLPELPAGVSPEDVLGAGRRSLDLSGVKTTPVAPRAQSTPPRDIPDIKFSFPGEQGGATTVVLGEKSTVVVTRKSPNISCINISSVNTREGTYASPKSIPEEPTSSTSSPVALTLELQPSTSSPLELPPSTSFPLELPPSTSFPLELPPSTSSPLELQPSTSSPLELQPSTSSPLKLPPTTSSPLKLPPSTSSPLELTPSTSSPLKLPPSTSSPLELPPTTSSPLELPPSTSSPLELPPSTSSPLELPPTTSTPVARTLNLPPSSSPAPSSTLPPTPNPSPVTLTAPSSQVSSPVLPPTPPALTPSSSLENEPLGSLPSTPLALTTPSASDSSCAVPPTLSTSTLVPPEGFTPSGSLENEPLESLPSTPSVCDSQVSATVLPPTLSTSTLVPPDISLPLELDWETVTECSADQYDVTSEGAQTSDYEYCDFPRRRATLMRERRKGLRTRMRRAWCAVRGWWSEEKLRIGDVIQRHAHAQAVHQDEQQEQQQQVVRIRRERPVSRAAARRSRYLPEGQNGFEELRRYIKQGGDFCKDLSSILQERSEAESQYAKSLNKLSGKLLKASKDSVGTVNQAWQRAGAQMEAQSEIHRAFATALSEEVVKPLRQLVEAQHRIRKSVEAAVDKTGKSLGEWRSAESKSKKQSFLCARENEKLQDAMLDVRLGRASSTTHLHVTGNQPASKDKESAKLESKRRKAEEAVKKADVEYYTFSLRAERARLEWETAVIRGSHCFQALEEERLQQLKDLAACYMNHLQEMAPKIVQGVERLREPVESCDVARDIQTVVSIKGTGQPIPEQLLPDFYAEHITLAMNRDRRRQALVKLLQLIRQDLDRERRGKQGVENLARALQQTPTFGAEDSQQNVTEKLHHMRSMLTYLEAMRYKVQSALAELDGRTRGGHPLAGHIQVTRDRQGLQQSVLKVPPWVREESLDRLAGDSPDWTDRGTADGNSVQPDSDFERGVCADEFSSQGSEKDYQSSVLTQCPVITEPPAPPADAVPSIGRCRALYEYTANLYDELNLQPGDVIKIHDKQADGWWLGELNGVVGIFPATYVQEID